MEYHSTEAIIVSLHALRDISRYIANCLFTHRMEHTAVKALGWLEKKDVQFWISTVSGRPIHFRIVSGHS